jgi:thimet oligopeptidase
MFYAALSMQLHARDPQNLSTDAVSQALQAKYAPFDYVPETHFQLSFGHLEGYSAIYYTYMWSLVIAKDLFSKFVTEGLLNPQTADRYRKTVLAPGGSADAASLVKDFLGRATTFDAFGHWLSE